MLPVLFIGAFRARTGMVRTHGEDYIQGAKAIGEVLMTVRAGLIILVSGFSLTVGGPRSLPAARPYSRVSEESVDLGRRIFEHNWARPESWTGPEQLGDGGDGLGPMFNEVSCVACHHLGGTGGAGANNHNVNLLSVDLRPTDSELRRMQLLEQAHFIHPHFTASNGTVLLHEFGFGPRDDEWEYQRFRSGLISRQGSSRAPGGARCFRMSDSAVPFELAQRNTPPLWGLGLIELIRRDNGERTRLRLAKQQRRSRHGVSGRIPLTMDGEFGWYGWRGHVSDLQQFVVNACANELGLEVPQQVQPENPLYSRLSRTRAKVLDLTENQVTALTAYLAKLPRPVQVLPDDTFEMESVELGEGHFQRIGCTECHPAKLASVDGVFSDLLLHDMGQLTSDRSTAVPARMPARTETRQTGGYSGASVTVRIPPQELPSNTDQEWRTPPLWGVSDSPPYYHDGRAATIHEAILLHDGEAAFSASAYRSMPYSHRQQLLSFLGTLRGPGAKEHDKSSSGESADSVAVN